jgi:hypothetical protein
VCLIGGVLTAKNDGLQTSSRKITVEAFALIYKEEICPILSMTTRALYHDHRPSGKLGDLDGIYARKSASKTTLCTD